ncbi:MAG: UDP-4-amino-4,6-dideoxy-N-acetyl-beta-L-altrosamine transaminase [Rickettsiaceae bacterium]
MYSKKFIPYGRQDISEDDINAVVEVLKGDFLTQGPTIKAFEDSIVKYTGAKYAVAVNSNTSGLHIACMALDLGENDLLWTSPNTFVASANCGRFCGADVDFVDIDLQTFNISISALKEKLYNAKKIGKLPKILVPVHMCGTACDMVEIKKLSVEYGFKIIEDSAHAIGARYNNKPVGSCEHSDISVFSFHPVKIITTGEGGIITTNDKNIYDRLLRLRTHGITREPEFMQNNNPGSWYYEMLELSHNYRMTDIQAALGLSQMLRLNEFVQKRNYLANKYIELFNNTSIRFQQISNNYYSSYHLFPILLVQKNSKKEIFEELKKANIGVNLHYIPVYLHPYYSKLGFKPGYCKNAEEYYKRAISIPLYPKMTEEDIEYIFNKIMEICSKYLNKDS